MNKLEDTIVSQKSAHGQSTIKEGGGRSFKGEHSFTRLQ